MSNRASDRTTPLDGLRLLVVEDEYFLATAISRALAGAGASVAGPFGDIADALAAVDAGPRPDGALLDINVRDAMVYPLADRLRAAGVPFLFMTGYDRSALPPAYRDVPICEKPVELRDVVRLLAPSTAGA